MTPTDIAAHVAAGLTAASRLVTVARPVWDKMPQWLALVMPVFFLALPHLANMAGLVHTETDLVHFGCVSSALLLPGVGFGVAAAKQGSKNS